MTDYHWIPPAMGKWQASQTNSQFICRRTTEDRMGQDVRQMANMKLEGPSGKDVEDWKIMQIKFKVDCSSHPEAMGSVMGHVGPPK